MRVPLYNQPLFLLSAPTLQLLLTSDGISYIVKTLPINQAGHVVVVTEAFKRIVLMLPYSIQEIVREPNVEHMTRNALHDVHIKGVFAFHRLSAPKQKVPRLRLASPA